MPSNPKTPPRASTTKLALKKATPPTAPAKISSQILKAQIESREAALSEDKMRLKRLKLAAALRLKPSPGWTTPKELTKLRKQWPGRLAAPPINHKALDILHAKLTAIVSGVDLASPASKMAMRKVRLRVFKALFAALKRYPDADLRTFAIVPSKFRFTPKELEAVSAAQLKQRLRTDLIRADVFKVRGPFVAFLDGEFDSVSGVYQLHFHGVTTVQKAAALSKLRRIRAYRTTVTGSAAIRISPVGDRLRQFTYLFKGWWTQHGIRKRAGTSKRDRNDKRIAEPFGAQVLIWLDRQKLGDLVLTNGCWSMRYGGPARMHKLYLSIFGSA